jgi:trimeric autotransporter adhesin
MKLRACFVVVVFLSTVVVSTLAQTAAPNSSVVSTQIPRLIKFSGVAQDEARKSLSGVVGVTFSLYKDQQGGSPLWVETQNVRADESGHYTVMLGSASADGVPLSLFSSAEAHWISTQVAGQPEQARVLLLSVPYALKAADAETLGGLPASAFMHASAGGAQGKAGSAAASSTQANLPPAGVTGKGTKDFVPMWTGATALGNSLIYQTGGNLGIGTKTPQAEVDVVGTGVRGIQATVPGTQAAISGIATAVKGGTTGVYGQSSDPGGNAMLAVNNATTGGYGVIGQSAATTGKSFGVAGFATSTTTGASGVLGNEAATTGQVRGVGGFAVSTTTNAAGVTGYESATTGQVYGVSGGTASTTNGASGVNGFEGAATGQVYGVNGGTSSTTNGAAGVIGSDTAATGQVFGVFGYTNSTTGAGVAGNANATTGQANGVAGTSASTSGTGVAASATATSGNTFGVFAQSVSPGGTGVVGYASATSGLAIGVTGATNSPAGVGGVFTNLAGGKSAVLIGNGPNTQVFIVDASGNGNFAGNLNVTGKLTKGSGSFKIDHPLDPANKYLSHSFVESPDMMNVYNGNITTDRHGLATVNLPDYFEALNGDFRYQLTVIGQFAQAIVARKIAANRFVIRTSKPNVEVSWQVTGIRHDGYANAYRIPVEEDKAAGEQGYYLHPEVFGQPASKSIAAASKGAHASRDVVADASHK